MHRSWMTLALGSTLWLAGCPGGPGPLDAPTPDVGGPDGGGPDGGGLDGGDLDGGRADAGGSDAGGSDAGGADAGGADAGGDAPGIVPCRTNDDCGSPRQYCARRDGACDADGVCAARPEMCPRIFAPVCGCDGADYPNACEAARAGASVASDGMCAPPAGACDLTPTAGCCFEDDECGTGRCVNALCRARAEGTCVGPVRAGQCWDDSDCDAGVRCVGANICPCGAACFVPDMPGTCGAATM